ncbi:MAG: adenylylsulfate reductase, thioredoxin dependent [Candidatus Eremiobacteraeota bacterium]|nr:adenylylsulfate reductase, thioredoxin dependent [Candidatus Eremiobacteraeota bacterium]
MMMSVPRLRCGTEIAVHGESGVAAVARAEAIVREVLAQYPGRVALACSFGGPSGMALLDLVLRVDRGVPVYYVDTGLLFPETHALVERAAQRYGIVPTALHSELSVQAQAERYGEALWARDPDACCAMRKVAPHRAFVAGYDAWFTGIRRVQARTRADVEPTARDGERLVKVSPLFDWTDEDVWAYVNEHDVPVNALHGDGYPSIGCMPCTLRPAPGEDARSGRWAGFGKTECGLHLAPQQVPG